jgi:hypothetical protein
MAATTISGTLSTLSQPNITISGSQIATATVTSAQLASGIDGALLTNGSVTADKLASGIGGGLTNFMFRQKQATQLYQSQGVVVTVSFPTEVSSSGMTYTASGSDFYVTIGATGKYIVQWSLTWDYSSSQSVVATHMTVNGTSNFFGYQSFGSLSSNDFATSSCAVVNLVANDQVRIRFMHNIPKNLTNNPLLAYEWGYLSIVQIQA